MSRLDCLVWLGVKRGHAGSSEIDTAISWRALIAEYLGTLLLVFMGTLLAVSPVTVDPIAGPFAGGLALGSIIQAVCHVSGGHINPAMSLGFFAARRMSLVKAALYAVAQCLGAISGSAILKAITPEVHQTSMGVTEIHPDLVPSQGFAIEICITFILVFMTVSATDSRRSDVNGSVPLAIGIYVVAAGLAAGPFTGASMNPARSLGPAVISGYWTNHWIYWAGPLFGGFLAGIVQHTLFDARFLDGSSQAYDLDDAPAPVGVAVGVSSPDRRGYEEELRQTHRGGFVESKGAKY
jgi:aquaporin related protein